MFALNFLLKLHFPITEYRKYLYTHFSTLDPDHSKPEQPSLYTAFLLQIPITQYRNYIYTHFSTPNTDPSNPYLPVISLLRKEL
jgi:hypothetical protein